MKRAQAAREHRLGVMIPFRVDDNDLVHRSPPIAGRSRREMSGEAGASAPGDASHVVADALDRSKICRLANGGPRRRREAEAAPAHVSFE
jgi:hypothetical protein